VADARSAKQPPAPKTDSNLPPAESETILRSLAAGPTGANLTAVPRPQPNTGSPDRRTVCMLLSSFTPSRGDNWRQRLCTSACAKGARRPTPNACTDAPDHKYPQTDYAPLWARVLTAIPRPQLNTGTTHRRTVCKVAVEFNAVQRRHLNTAFVHQSARPQVPANSLRTG
jgi:hypothetical protein